MQSKQYGTNGKWLASSEYSCLDLAKTVDNANSPASLIGPWSLPVQAHFRRAFDPPTTCDKSEISRWSIAMARQGCARTERAWWPRSRMCTSSRARRRRGRRWDWFSLLFCLVHVLRPLHPSTRALLWESLEAKYVHLELSQLTGLHVRNNQLELPELHVRNNRMRQFEIAELGLVICHRQGPKETKQKNSSYSFKRDLKNDQ